MIDSRTVSAIAAETGIPVADAQRILADAEARPGVSDPIALGRSWCRRHAVRRREQAASESRTIAARLEREQAENLRSDGSYADPDLAARYLGIMREIAEHPALADDIRTLNAAGYSRDALASLFGRDDWRETLTELARGLRDAAAQEAKS